MRDSTVSPPQGTWGKPGHLPLSPVLLRVRAEGPLGRVLCGLSSAVGLAGSPARTPFPASGDGGDPVLPPGPPDAGAPQPLLAWLLLPLLLSLLFLLLAAYFFR